MSMLLLGLVRVGRLLAVLPFAEHARGDRERGADERDLDVPVTVGSPLTSRRAARIRSASAKCSPAAVGIRGVLVTCARFDREWIGERPSLRCVPVEDLSGELTGMRVSNGCVLPRTRAYRHDSARVGFG